MYECDLNNTKTIYGSSVFMKKNKSQQTPIVVVNDLYRSKFYVEEDKKRVPTASKNKTSLSGRRMAVASQSGMSYVFYLFSMGRLPTAPWVVVYCTGSRRVPIIYTHWIETLIFQKNPMHSTTEFRCIPLGGAATPCSYDQTVTRIDPAKSLREIC